MPAMNICCPKCLPNVRTQLVQNGHKVECGAGHSFEDTVELTSYKLEPFSGPAFTPPPQLPPPSASTLSIVIDSKLYTALQNRFGAKLEASMVAMATVLAQPGSFVVDTEDAQRISQNAGIPVKDGMTLAGAVFSGFKDLRDAKEKITALENNRNGGSTTAADCVSVKLDMDHVVKIAEKAAFNGKKVADMLGEMIVHALDNGWI